MTEEIINGVDVSGCKHYWNTHNLELCKINFDNNYYSNGLPLAKKCIEHKDCYYKQMKRLETENAKLKEELNRYKEMEAKGLEEFKDVGGCWGCGLQLQLNQDIKDLKKYGQENVELLQENAKLKEKYQEELTVNTQLRKWQDEDLRQIAELKAENAKLKEALKKIKENIEPCSVGENCSICNFDFCANKDILKIIEEVLKDE